jgi:hypothetical protein
MENNNPQGYIVVSRAVDGSKDNVLRRIKPHMNSIFESLSRIGWFGDEEHTTELRNGYNGHVVILNEELFDQIMNLISCPDQVKPFLYRLYSTVTEHLDVQDVNYTFFPAAEASWDFDTIIAFFYGASYETQDNLRNIKLTNSSLFDGITK